MFCPNCGHDCKEENFCAKCGMELHAAEETDTPAVCNVGSERKDDVATRLDRVCLRIEQMYHASSIHYILAALSLFNKHYYWIYHRNTSHICKSISRYP